MSEQKKKNALVKVATIEKDGKTYHNVFVTIYSNDGEITLLVKPICKSNKTYAKLLYKLSKCLGE